MGVARTPTSKRLRGMAMIPNRSTLPILVRTEPRGLIPTDVYLLPEDLQKKAGVGTVSIPELPDDVSGGLNDRAKDKVKLVDKAIFKGEFGFTNELYGTATMSNIKLAEALAKIKDGDLKDAHDIGLKLGQYGHEGHVKSIYNAYDKATTELVDSIKKAIKEKKFDDAKDLIDKLSNAGKIGTATLYITSLSIAKEDAKSGPPKVDIPINNQAGSKTYSVDQLTSIANDLKAGHGGAALLASGNILLSVDHAMANSKPIKPTKVVELGKAYAIEGDYETAMVMCALLFYHEKSWTGEILNNAIIKSQKAAGHAQTPITASNYGDV